MVIKMIEPVVFNFLFSYNLYLGLETEQKLSFLNSENYIVMAKYWPKMAIVGLFTQ